MESLVLMGMQYELVSQFCIIIACILHYSRSLYVFISFIP